MSRAHRLCATEGYARRAATRGRAVGRDAVEYRVLATSKTSTMEHEIDEAADADFRVDALMGGETALGAWEIVTILEQDGTP